MRNCVVIFVNGQRHEVHGDLVFQPLSTWLRDSLGLTGTKIVCAEGDCGSCTVLLGLPRNGSLRYHTVCSCIQYLFQLDATHVVSIEGLLDDGQLNPIQESMVTCHGAQCGFCTPGVVVSLYALFHEQTQVEEQDLRAGLVGNLCRCTGYEPILGAGRCTNPHRVRPLTELFDTDGIARELAQRECEPVLVQCHGRRFFMPVTLADAVVFRAAHPDCTFVAGGTDLGVLANKGKLDFQCVLSARGLTDLFRISTTDSEIVAGACVSIAELERAARTPLPEFSRMLTRFGSPQIQNAGTLGGNIANGSPIGDSMPTLFVLNAQVELTGPSQKRMVNINEFYTGYRSHVMRSDELITRVHIPLLGEGETLHVYKISKRRDLDISSFCAAVWLRLNGSTIDDVRMAYGGVAAMIRRLTRTETFLRGKVLSADLFARAGDMAAEEIQPISDVRGSAEFRYQLARNIPRKLFYELCGAN